MTSRGSSLILQTLFHDLDVHPSWQLDSKLRWQLDSNSDMTTHIPYIYNVGCGNHGLTMVNCGSSALTVVNPSPQTHLWYKMVDQPSTIGALRHWLYLYHMTAVQVPIFWQQITNVENSGLSKRDNSGRGRNALQATHQNSLEWCDHQVRRWKWWYIDQKWGYNNPKSSKIGV